MTVIDVRNTLGMIGLPPAFIGSYGLKTAGYVRLQALQSACPIRYEVPPAWAIPPRSQGRATEWDLRQAFDDLTQGLSEEAVFMARGSSLAERPGESPTLFFRFDPHGRRQSFRTFVSKIGEVRATHDDMGVLATIMVGGLHLFRDGTRAIGWDNVSFVADTHHPMAPQDIHIAAVSGLGTQAVLPGGEAVFITADRHLGLINSFVNKTEEAFLLPNFGSRPCLDRKAYRQKRADYFDPDRETIASRELESDFIHWFRFNPETGIHREDYPRVYYGHLVRRMREVSPAAEQKLRAIPGYGDQEIEVGINPFLEGTPLMNVIGILQFLAENVGPVQVEGGFLTGASPMPFLYQLQDTPESLVSRLPLSAMRRDLHSQEIIGVADFTGPLLWTRSATADVLSEMDRCFADTGYMLLTSGHEGRLIEATPHCRIRLATGRINVGSHAVMLARLKMRESPDAGYLLAQNVGIVNAAYRSINGRRKDEERAGVHIFHRARLESNGSEMAVEILSGVAE